LRVEDVLMYCAFVFCFLLHTHVGLINDVYLWKVTGIIAVAVIGKFVGSACGKICWTKLA
jgi:hypothetical protein